MARVARADHLAQAGFDLRIERGDEAAVGFDLHLGAHGRGGREQRMRGVGEIVREAQPLVEVLLTGGHGSLRRVRASSSRC